MATVTIKQFRGWGFDLDGFNEGFVGLTKVSGNSTSAVMKFKGFNEEFILSGSGFKFDSDGKLTAGTIIKMVVETEVNGDMVKAIEFTDFSVSVTKLRSDPTYEPFNDVPVIYDASGFTQDVGVGFTGSQKDDKITGSKYGDSLYGSDGGDSLYGGAGIDWIVGNSGANRLFGQDGDDILVSAGSADYLSGGAGSDWINYEFETAGVTVNLATNSKNAGAAKGDTYLSVENVIGTKANDSLTGDSKNNILDGWTGKDTLGGGDGDDILYGGADADKLSGGAGSDTAAYSYDTPAMSFGSDTGVIVDMQDMSLNTGEAKGDTFSSIENVTGTNHADKIYGNGSGNVLSGAKGDDILSGRGGKDTLIGGAGADKLYGGTTAADVFAYKKVSDSTVSKRDTIFDFGRSQGDKIDLSAIDASTKSSGNQAFSFIGTKDFSGKAGELRFDKKASDTYVYVDINGDGKSDLSIHLDDAMTLYKTDFIL